MPLNRLAAKAQADRVRAASLNPSAEVEAAHAANPAVDGVNQPTLGNDPLKIPEPAKAQP